MFDVLMSVLLQSLAVLRDHSIRPLMEDVSRAWLGISYLA